MISFKQFLFEEQQLLVCGGNVQIDLPSGETVSAERINLLKHAREQIVPELEKGLRAFNIAFEKFSGLPLWSKELLKSLDYLSGSAKHFFDISKIKSDEFVPVKGSVGDIDTMIDGSMASIVKNFLDSLSVGTVFDTISWVGYKQSGEQFITLFKTSFGVNVQVDMEHVEFVGGKPTRWSQFSHSSAWEDMQAKIKGLFSKYLFRAITAKGEIDAIVLTGKRQTPKKKNIAPYSASLKGIRERIQPVLDENGNQKFQDGLPVYVELPSAGALYYTDLEVFFSILFDGRKPSTSDLNDLMSFVGITGLIAKYFTPEENKKILDRFAEIMFETGAQAIYRGREGRLLDFRDKTIALRMICQKLGFKWSEYLPMIKKYYKSYK